MIIKILHGYKNPNINNALIDQINTLPQIASQYLHVTKIKLAEILALDIEKNLAKKEESTLTWGGSISRRLFKISKKTSKRQKLNVCF